MDSSGKDVEKLEPSHTVSVNIATLEKFGNCSKLKQSYYVAQRISFLGICLRINNMSTHNLVHECLQKHHSQ